jgi:hypothetical protein
VLPEVGKDFEKNKKEVLETMTKANFDIVDTKVIDLKAKK